MSEAVAKLGIDWKALIRKLRPSGDKVWLTLFVVWALVLLRDLVNVKLGTYYFVWRHSLLLGDWHHSLVDDTVSIGVDMALVSFYWFMYQRSRNTIR